MVVGAAEDARLARSQLAGEADVTADVPRDNPKVTDWAAGVEPPVVKLKDKAGGVALNTGSTEVPTVMLTFGDEAVYRSPKLEELTFALKLPPALPALAINDRVDVAPAVMVPNACAAPPLKPPGKRSETVTPNASKSASCNRNSTCPTRQTSANSPTRRAIGMLKSR